MRIKSIALVLICGLLLAGCGNSNPESIFADAMEHLGSPIQVDTPSVIEPEGLPLSLRESCSPMLTDGLEGAVQDALASALSGATENETILLVSETCEASGWAPTQCIACAIDLVHYVFNEPLENIFALSVAGGNQFQAGPFVPPDPPPPPRPEGAHDICLSNGWTFSDIAFDILVGIHEDARNSSLSRDAFGLIMMNSCLGLEVLAHRTACLDCNFAVLDEVWP